MNRVRLALASAVAVACMITGTVVASADPDAVAQARAELDRIHQEASALDQDIIEAHDRAAQAEAKLTTLSKDLKSQEAKVADLTSQLGDVAHLQLQTDSVSLTAQLLLSSDSDNFLSGLATIHAEADRSNTGIQQLQLDQAKLTTLREDAAKAEETLKKEAAAKVALAEEYDAKEAEAQRVYDRLSAEEQQRLAAIEAERVAQAELAQRQAEERAAADTTSRSRGTDGAATTSAAPSASASASPSATKTEEAPAATQSSGSSSRAQAAVDAALSKVGSRYVWGTSGPNTFDCSGLTSWAYRQVGINLSRSSKAQWSSAGVKVSKSDLRPGDLVFYYSPVSHVGLYIGNGKIVHAANPRSGVNITSLNSMSFTGARRVVG